MLNSVKTAGQAIRVGSKLLGVAPKYWDSTQFKQLQGVDFTPQDNNLNLEFMGGSAVTPKLYMPRFLENTLSSTGMSSLMLGNHWYNKSSIVEVPVYGEYYYKFGGYCRDVLRYNTTCPNHWPIVFTTASDNVANVTSSESLAGALSACKNNEDSRVMIEYAFNSDGTFEYSRLSVMLSRLLKAATKQVLLVDTIGCATPSSVKSLVEKFRTDFGGEMSRIALGFDDSNGMAPLNFLSAVECGVENHLVALDSSSSLYLFDARKAALLCSALDISTTLNYTGICRVFDELTSEAEKQQGKSR